MSKFTATDKPTLNKQARQHLPILVIITCDKLLGNLHFFFFHIYTISSLQKTVRLHRLYGVSPPVSSELHELLNFRPTAK